MIDILARSVALRCMALCTAQRSHPIRLCHMPRGLARVWCRPTSSRTRGADLVINSGAAWTVTPVGIVAFGGQARPNRIS